MRRAKALVVGLVIAGISSGIAVAAVTESLKTKSKGLQGIFSIGDNCQAAFTTVNYAEAVIKTIGNKEIQEPLIFVEVDYVNNCTNDHLIMTGVSNQVQAQIQGNLDKAHLTANVKVADETGTQTATLSVNLNWVGSGPLSTVSDKSKSKEGNVVMKSSFTFQSRVATASGTIAGVLPLTGGSKYTNLTQGPSMSANIGTSRTGNVTITKKH